MGPENYQGVFFVVLGPVVFCFSFQQGAHAAALLCVLLAVTFFALSRDRSIVAVLAHMAYILAFGLSFGLQFWMTFVNGEFSPPKGCY